MLYTHQISDELKSSCTDMLYTHQISDELGSSCTDMLYTYQICDELRSSCTDVLYSVEYVYLLFQLHVANNVTSGTHQAATTGAVPECGGDRK